VIGLEVPACVVVDDLIGFHVHVPSENGRESEGEDADVGVDEWTNANANAGGHALTDAGVVADWHALPK
jgi:hypothetical protein